MVREGGNTRYLPGAAFPDNLRPVVSLEDCLAGVRDILVAVPSHGLRATLIAIRPHLNKDSRVCWATKGFELHTGMLPHQVVA